MAETNKEALQELLKLLSEKPEIIDRLTITIRPTKLVQGDDKKK